MMKFHLVVGSVCISGLQGKHSPPQGSRASKRPVPLGGEELRVVAWGWQIGQLWGGSTYGGGIQIVP